MPVYANPLEYQGNALAFSSPGPGLDPDFLTWASAVEDAGATFGPDAATIATNKAAWNAWITSVKAEGIWAQLTTENVGYIQPLIGVSSHLAPSLFGAGTTYPNFVSGDFNPLLGLLGNSSSNKHAIPTSRNTNASPQDSFYYGAYATEAVPEGSRVIFGQTGSDAAGAINLSVNGSVTRAKGANQATQSQSGLVGLVSVNRRDSANFQTGRGASIIQYSGASTGNSTGQWSYFAVPGGSSSSTTRLGILFAGLSLTDDQMIALNTISGTLAGAIEWT